MAKRKNSYQDQFEEELSDEKLGKNNKSQPKEINYKSELLLICASKDLFESSLVSSIRKYFSKTQHGMIHGDAASGYLIGLSLSSFSLKKKTVSFSYQLKKKHRAKTNTVLFMIQNALAKEFIVPLSDHQEIEDSKFFPEFGNEEILINIDIGVYGRNTDEEKIELADRIGRSIVECFNKFITSSI